MLYSHMMKYTQKLSQALKTSHKLSKLSQALKTLKTMPTTSYPRAFTVSVSRVPDHNGYHGRKAVIPFKWLSNLMRDSEVGIPKVLNSMRLHERTTRGCPRWYEMSVLVDFDNSINLDIRKRLEGGERVKITTLEKGEKNPKTGNINKKDEYVIVEKYTTHNEMADVARQKKRDEEVLQHNAMRLKKEKVAQKKTVRNAFDILSVE